MVIHDSTKFAVWEYVEEAETCLILYQIIATIIWQNSLFLSKKMGKKLKTSKLDSLTWASLCLGAARYVDQCQRLMIIQSLEHCTSFLSAIFKMVWVIDFTFEKLCKFCCLLPTLATAGILKLAKKHGHGYQLELVSLTLGSIVLYLKR